MPQAWRAFHRPPPEEHLGQANGIVYLADMIAAIVSPILAAALVTVIQLQGIVLVDFATFLFAVAALLLVHVPSPKTSAEGESGKGGLVQEAGYSWKYLIERPGLLGLSIYLIFSFAFHALYVLLTPLVLGFSSAGVLGNVLALGAAGGFVGGVAFLFMSAHPIATGSSMTTWQRKVAQDIQGRVLAASMVISQPPIPPAYLVAGPLADYVFEPLPIPGERLADSVGLVIGQGQSRGIGLLIILMGMLVTFTAVVAFFYPRMHLVEQELPDAIPDRAENKGVGS